jgi:hypothetical protein
LKHSTSNQLDRQYRSVTLTFTIDCFAWKLEVEVALFTPTFWRNLMSNNLWIELSDDSAQNVSGGFNSAFGTVYFNEYFKVDKELYSDVRVRGYLATAESDAKAYGKGAVAQIFTYTETTPFGAYSQGTSISASN